MAAGRLASWQAGRLSGRQQKGNFVRSIDFTKTCESVKRALIQAQREKSIIKNTTDMFS